jgi:hypothetical protein
MYGYLNDHFDFKNWGFKWKDNICEKLLSLFIVKLSDLGNSYYLKRKEPSFSLWKHVVLMKEGII